MTLRTAKARSGITLTEILISILIMGVGLVSLATLFPLGLIRLRQANQQSRSSYLAESALADLQARDLLSKKSFLNSWYGGMYYAPAAFDPFLYDIPLSTTQPAIIAGQQNVNGVIVPDATGGGLPICYDPLFLAVTNNAPAVGVGFANPYFNTLFGFNQPIGANELRFGAGVVQTGGTTVSFVRANPSGGVASAHGLQRITNFLLLTPGTANWPFTYQAGGNGAVGATFASPEDVVFHDPAQGSYTLINPVTGVAGTATTPPASTTPELNQTGNVLNDWKFTWLFTGRQTDVTKGTVFDGDIVICDSRPFGVDSLLSVYSNTSAPVASGEYVYEAIFGFSGSLLPAATGYSVGADRTVLIRWPDGVADPEIKIGSWIADVTYERTAQTTRDRLADALTVRGNNSNIPLHPMQRCHWYQVAKRTEAEADPAGGRRMTLFTSTPLKAKTLLTIGAGGPTAIHLNVALFMPSVVNVFPRTVFSRNGK